MLADCLKRLKEILVFHPVYILQNFESQLFSRILWRVVFYHVLYVFESTLYSYLNVKELIALNRSNIWSLSDCNGIGTQKHLVHKQTYYHLAKLAILAKSLSVCLQSRCLWVRIQLQSCKLLKMCFRNWKWVVTVTKDASTTSKIQS